MRRIASIPLSLLIFSLVDWNAQADEGPLLTRSESLGQLFRLNPPMQNANLLEAGLIDFDLSRTYANLWACDKRFAVDGELADDQAHMALGLGAGFQLGLGFSLRRFAQADTDQIAITFHDLFRLGQDGRLEAGKHHTRFVIPDYSLEFTRQNLDRSFSEQAVLDLSYALLTARRMGWDLSLTVMASYEMANFSPYFQGAIDRGWQLSARLPTGLWNFYGSIRQLEFDTSRQVLVPTRASNGGWGGGLAYSLPDQQALIWQFMVNQPMFHELGQLSKNSYEWQLGYRYRWEALTLEAAVIENIFWLYNSPDWGFSFGLHSALK